MILVPMHVCAVRPRKDDAVIRVYDEGWQCDRDAGARGPLQRVRDVSPQGTKETTNL